jgi:hypothetical protein
VTEQRRTIQGWAAVLSVQGEALTMDEARLWAALATYDRTVELLTACQDVQMRIQRIETFLGVSVPAYDPLVRAALGNGKD